MNDGLNEITEDMATELVELLGRAWRSLDNLCVGLSSEDWDRATDCPGWTVKDIVSHIAGTEAWLLGHPLPDHQPATADHVKNEIARINEVLVDFRRPWPPEEVLEDFRQMTGERLTVLETWTNDDLAADSWTPFGPGTAGRLLEARIGDSWIHEQDIRRAVGRPGHDDGPVARHVLQDLANSGLGYVVAKKAGCPDGTTIEFHVTGRAGFRSVVSVSGGRGTLVKSVEGAVQATITTDQETFLCLVAGRRAADRALDEGSVSIDGDQDVGRRVVLNMKFMF